jgi:hypothetical protein
MNDEETINFLSKDQSFGILTRQALILKLFTIKDHTSLYLIDLNNIHKLNMTLGYYIVNEKVRRALDRLKDRYPNLIVGRVFSGDEILIADINNYEDLLNNLINLFSDEKIGFKFIISSTKGFLYLDSVSNLIDTLSNKLINSSYFRALK